MTKISITDVVSTVVTALEPLSSEERHRVVRASMTLLGEAEIESFKKHASDEPTNDTEDSLPKRTQAWMKQNGISLDQIHQVFHLVDGSAEFIASEVPGKNNRQKVHNAYILSGISQFLSTGEAKFNDKSARAVCEKYGFFDSTNHMKYMKAQEFTGSRDRGWTLTAPGLKRGAILVTELG